MFLKYPGLRSDYVKAGLFFPEEVTVEPRTIQVVRVHDSEYGVKTNPNTTIVNCEST
jgi:hypothetical protein